MKINKISFGQTTIVQNNVALSKTQPNSKMTTPIDAFSQKSMYNEHLRVVYTDNQGHLGYEGSINDKVTFLSLSNSKGHFTRTGNLDGILGDKKVNLKFKSDHSSATFEGVYDNTPVTFLIKTKSSGKGTITGTIGDKEIKIIFPGSSINETKKQDDILTLLTSLGGYKLNIDNGVFTKLALSDQSTITKSVKRMELWDALTEPLLLCFMVPPPQK